MSNKKLQKLELNWIGKGDEPKLEPRILIENPEYSYGDPDTENMLIHGDNLLALKALEQDFAGKIKCIYIDPPFNTGAAFEHYDDGIEHSLWLDLMYRRIKFLFNILNKKGSIFIHLDDNEVDYCKIILDEIFGRNNFINRITVEARSPSAFSTVNPGVFKSSEYILWYAKNKQEWLSKSMRIPAVRDAAYNKYILNRTKHESNWEFIPLRKIFLEKLNEDKLDQIETFIKHLYEKGRNLTKAQLAHLITSIFPLHILFNLKQVTNYLWNKLKLDSFHNFKSSVYMYLLEKCSYNYKEKDIEKFVFFNADAVYRETEISDQGAGQEIVNLKYKSLELPNKVLRLERFNNLDDVYVLNGKQLSFYSKNVTIIEDKPTATKLLTNVWSDISWEGIAGEGNVKFKKGKKPERLLERCIELTTMKDDIVLDSFLGSGTTAAVAQKMGRKWIGVELGEHAITHCIPRLKKVTDGEQGGISKALNWKGGGGFKFYTLAPSLLNEDKYGNWVIAKEYNATMMAAAMAKQEGFRYQPHESMYWKQGKSSEQDFIFTTTQFITVETMDRIHDEMQPGESLLICCKAFQRGCKSKYPNITIKKIPQMLLGKCEFGKEDYSLHIVNMPEEEDHTETINIQEDPVIIENQKGKKHGKGNTSKDQPTLF